MHSGPTYRRLRHSALLAVVFAACAGERSETGPLTPSECGSEVTADYEQAAEPFLTQFCTPCHASNLPALKRHGAPLDHNFDSEAGVRDVPREHVELNLTPQGDQPAEMPPPGYPQPTAEERAAFLEWLNCAEDR